MSKRVFRGVVKKVGPNTSVLVSVATARRHKSYGKVIKGASHFRAETHLVLTVGDVVEIVESRPLSKIKRFVVSKIAV